MGFDEDLFRPRDKSQEQFRVLFTGFYYHKGADLAAKVARALGRTHRNISFIFVDGARKTDADNALSYKNYLSERSADNTLIFDQMDEEKFAELLGQAHLLLFPSRWESFGRVVVEALGSGCPVNCFDIMGPPCSLIRSSGTGYVARAFDPNELAYGILKFYDLWKSRFDEYLELSEKCRRLSLRFSWKRLAPMYLRMFEAVAGLGQT
jgi:glycosyltransferase involved in cell wall biosynthesis